MDRKDIAAAIRGRPDRDGHRLREAWLASRPVRHLAIDDLLPEEVAAEAWRTFPTPKEMRFRDDFRERKYAGADTRLFQRPIVEILYAFQDSGVLALLEGITGLAGLEADPSLYASGVSLMERGHFLNPHIDNSHDGEVRRYRVLNALYYVTPGWGAGSGGSLELWDDAGKERAEIPRPLQPPGGDADRPVKLALGGEGRRRGAPLLHLELLLLRAEPRAGGLPPRHHLPGPARRGGRDRDAPRRLRAQPGGTLPPGPRPRDPARPLPAPRTLRPEEPEARPIRWMDP